MRSRLWPAYTECTKCIVYEAWRRTVAGGSNGPAHRHTTRSRPLSSLILDRTLARLLEGGWCRTRGYRLSRLVCHHDGFNRHTWGSNRSVSIRSVGYMDGKMPSPRHDASSRFQVSGYSSRRVVSPSQLTRTRCRSVCCRLYRARDRAARELAFHLSFCLTTRILIGAARASRLHQDTPLRLCISTLAHESGSYLNASHFSRACPRIDRQSPICTILNQATTHTKHPTTHGSSPVPDRPSSKGR